MTPSEFKAWFDGFTEAFGGVPTKTQWARIKARVAEIDGRPVTERVYVDRYWPTVIREYPAYVPNWRYTPAVCLSQQTTNLRALSAGQLAQAQCNQATANSFNSSVAMADLGRAEAKALAC